ncbi:uncharacterized protein DS421_8g245620 [Arachis hypogaea]|nr:uncharacterized protein DS421_8g245620 [Arachis hypogaea]
MDQGVLDILIRPETRLSDESVDLFALWGEFQAGKTLKEEGVSEVIGLGWLVVEHGEEEREGVEVVGGVGAAGIGADDGVVVIGVGAGDGAEEEASVGEVAAGREGGESEELGDVARCVVVLSAHFQELRVELERVGHASQLHHDTTQSPTHAH